MARKKARGRTKKSPRTVPSNRTAKRATRHTLLILECDTTKLRAQGLSIVETLPSALGVLSSPNGVVTIPTTSEAQLLADFQRLVEAKTLFDTILVIAHSNRNEIVLTSDGKRSWRAFAKWLEPLQPRKILLLACEAGRLLSAKDMFDNIGSLRELHASPVRTNKRQGIVLGVLAAFQIMKVTPSNDLMNLIKGLNLVLTDGVIFSWTRDECESPRETDILAWNVVQELLPGLRQIIRTTTTSHR